MQMPNFALACRGDHHIPGDPGQGQVGHRPLSARQGQLYWRISKGFLGSAMPAFDE
jgi:hypothetical protein